VGFILHQQKEKTTGGKKHAPDRLFWPKGDYNLHVSGVQGTGGV